MKDKVIGNLNKYMQTIMASPGNSEGTAQVILNCTDIVRRTFEEKESKDAITKYPTSVTYFDGKKFTSGVIQLCEDPLTEDGHKELLQVIRNQEGDWCVIMSMTRLHPCRD